MLRDAALAVLRTVSALQEHEAPSNNRHTAAGLAERFNGLSPVGQVVALGELHCGYQIDMVGVRTAEKNRVDKLLGRRLPFEGRAGLCSS